jgi:hypothetical protein
MSHADSVTTTCPYLRFTYPDLCPQRAGSEFWCGRDGAPILVRSARGKEGGES